MYLKSPSTGAGGLLLLRTHKKKRSDMKRFLVFILGAFICLQSFAQVSVSAGYVNTNYRLNRSGSITGDGFFLGLGYEIASTNLPQVSLAPEVNFNFIDLSRYADNARDKFLSVPVHVKYTIPMSNVMDMYFSAGPNLVIPLDDGVFDVAFGFSAGALMASNVKLFLRYDIGVINQAPDSGYNLTRNIFHLGVGYLF